MTTSEDRTFSVVMWIASIFAPVIGPLIFLLLSGRKPLTYANSIHALVFHVAEIVSYVVFGIIAVATCGLGSLLLVIPAILHIGVPILGALAAANGEALFARSGIVRR